jgi:hypothetical protein
MAVTETEERVSESEEEPDRAEDGSRRAEDDSSQPEDNSSEAAESTDADSAPKPSHLLRKVAGGVIVFLLLGIYFVWIGSEMGAHATAGSTEMWAIFGGIFIGVVAALAGGAMMRRNN